MNVFISYAFKDSVLVDKIVSTFKNKMSDVNFIYDKDTIRYGDGILEFIKESLKHSDVFMPFISRNYIVNQSLAKFEYDEIFKRYLSEKKKIIPVFIEDVPIKDLPLGISYIRSYNLNSIDNSINELSEVLKSSGKAVEINISDKDIDSGLAEIELKIQASKTCNQICNWCNNDEFEEVTTLEPVKNIVQQIFIEITRQEKYKWLNFNLIFTGKEPLFDVNYFIEILKNVPDEVRKTSKLLTNGYLLTDDVAKELHSLQLGEICINLNYVNDSFIKDNIKIEGSIWKYDEKIINNINNLQRYRFKVTVSHVLVTKDQINEVNLVINKVIEKIDKSILNKILFIQKDRSEYDIFSIGKKWFDGKIGRTDIGFYEHKYEYKELIISFYKKNCASPFGLGKDKINECLNCVGKKEIAISGDGRIRLCGNTLLFQEKHYHYQHIDENNPIEGIEMSLKSQYANAGFYGHFTSIITQERDVSNCTNWNINYENVKNSLLYNNLFEKIFDTGSENDETLKLITEVIKNSYDIMQKVSLNIDDKITFNINLMIAINLCIDQNLFSTSRSELIIGLPYQILSMVLKHQADISTDENMKNELLEITTWCIATIAYEKCNEKYIEEYIIQMAGKGLIEKSCTLSYLVGCIRRQQQMNQEAIHNFMKALDISDKMIEKPSPILSFFQNIPKEIYVESLRSLGSAFRKNDKELSNRYFEKAGYYSRIFSSKLCYAVSYSLGYSAMENYFKNYSNPNERVEFFFQSHRYYFESLQSKSNNPITLVRLGLLELAEGETKIAINRLGEARDIFQKKGLLTDLEYINYWLNETIIDTAIEISKTRKQPTNIITKNIINELANYINAGENDINCAMKDAGYLLKVANKLETVNNQNIRKYIENCKKLLAKKRIPFSVVISVTENCNATCIGCFAPKSVDEMPEEMIIDIINKLKKAGVKRVSFGGGEPTLYKYLKKAVGHAHDNGLITAISSNGILIAKNEFNLKEYAGILDELILDYHSTNASISSKFSPHMDKKHLSDIEDKFKEVLENKWFQLKVATIITKDNLRGDDLIQTGKKLKEIGIKVWKVDQYFHVDVTKRGNNDKIKEDYSISDEEYRTKIQELQETLTELKIVGIGADFKRNQKNFVISPKGKAVKNNNGINEEIGDFIFNYNTLFYDNHSYLPFENYRIYK